MKKPGTASCGMTGTFTAFARDCAASGDIVFVRVVDYDRNANAQLAETIDATHFTHLPASQSMATDALDLEGWGEVMR